MAVAEEAGGGVAEAVVVGKGFSPASLSFKGKEFRGWGRGEGEGVEQGIWEGATVAGGGGEEMVAMTSSCFPSTYTPPTFPSLPTPTFVPSLAPVAQVGEEGRSVWMSLLTTRPPGTSSLLGHTYPAEGQNIQELW